jgi:hypothetical protein
MALCSHGQYEEDSGYPEQNPPDYLRREQIYIKYFNIYGAKHYNLERTERAIADFTNTTR